MSWRRWSRNGWIWLVAGLYAAMFALDHTGSRLPAPSASRGDSLWVLLGVLLNSDLLLTGRSLLLGVALIAYGAVRAILPNPVMPTKYGAWIATTPWRLGEPLPNGSPFLQAWDVVLVAGLTLLSVADLQWFYATAPFLFLVSYALPLLYVTSTEPVVLSVGILLAPLLVYPHYNLYWGALVFLVLCGLLVWGLRCRLRRFPFERDDWQTSHGFGNRGATLQLGYPYNTLGPNVVERSEGLVPTAVLIAVGMWWIHAVIDFGMTQEGDLTWSELANGIAGLSGDEAVRRIWWLVVIGVATFRWGLYRCFAAPPIGIVGRFGTKRLVIPSYDRIWLGPLCALLVGGWAPIALNWAGVPYSLVPTLSIGLLLATACLVGPNLETWRLTGLGRIQKRWRTTSSKSQKQQVGLGQEIHIELNLFGKRR